MTKPAFRPIAAPLDVDDEALGRLADQIGVPTLVKPSPPLPPGGPQIAPDGPTEIERTPAPPAPQASSRVKKPASAPVPRRTRLEKLTVEVPGYLIDAIKREALDQRSCARHVLMLALRNAGFKVDEADMVPDGRRQHRKTERS